MIQTSVTSTAHRKPHGRRLVDKVLPGDARRHNRALVLQQLFDSGPLSRADIARATALTRVTVSELVTELLDDDIVSELGPKPGTRMGKPATLVGLSELAPVAIALDLSGDEVMKGAIVDLRGAIVHREEIAFARGEEAVKAVITLVDSLKSSARQRVLGVGIGTPGIITADGVVLQAPNLEWENLDLADVVEAATSLPTYVGNDANIAAVSESAFGAGDDGGLLLITIGQGVGGGVLIDGRSLSGPLLSAGEIGHIVVEPDGARCNCGNRGCLETLLAVPHLRRLADPKDRAHVGSVLGSVLTPIVTTLGIADVVLYGPTGLLEGPLLEATREALAKQTLPFVAQRIQVRLAPLTDELVLTGAAAQVRYRELGVA